MAVASSSPSPTKPSAASHAAPPGFERTLEIALFERLSVRYLGSSGDERMFDASLRRMASTDGGAAAKPSVLVAIGFVETRQ